MSSAVGADIESMCSKCGDVWHVVVAKVGDKIAKVQCKECGAYHRHRPPGGTKAAATVRRRSATAPRSARAAARADKAGVEPDLSRPVRPYRIDESYEPGDRIDHPTFGLGVVQGSPGTGKIEVTFPDGRRIMAQARSRGTLEPPPRRTFDGDA